MYNHYQPGVSHDIFVVIAWVCENLAVVTDFILDKLILKTIWGRDTTHSLKTFYQSPWQAQKSANIKTYIIGVYVFEENHRYKSWAPF